MRLVPLAQTLTATQGATPPIPNRTITMGMTAIVTPATLSPF
jgi:hypothetical protein